MHAQFSIAHSAIAAVAIRAGLEEVFGGDDRAVLARSAVFSANSDTWKDLVIYSTERPTYRLVCLPARNDELQAIVSGGRGH
jgi:hypothetical protein